MKLSVITVVYNDLDGIKSTVQSLSILLEREDVEYIVVDGLSSDGTKEFLLGCNKIDFFLSEKDRGIYDAMNKGISMSSGDFVLFINSGDKLVEGFSLDDTLSGCLTNDIVLGQVIRTSKAGPAIQKKELIRSVSSSLFKVSPPCHQAMLINRHCFEDIGVYNTEYSLIADNVWFLDYLLSKRSIKAIKVLDIPISYYDIDGLSSIRRSTVIKERYRMISESNASKNLKILMYMGLILYHCKFQILCFLRRS